jgi:hypothetical protein
MYPFFVAGYLYNTHKDKIKYLKHIQALSLIIFPIMLIFWVKDYYIYVTGMNIYVQDIPYKLWVILYRYAIGFAGTISIISVAKLSFKFFKMNWLIGVGKYTLGIYLLQNFSASYFSLIPIGNSAFLVIPVITVTFVLLAIFVIKLIQICLICGSSPK